MRNASLSSSVQVEPESEIEPLVVSFATVSKPIGISDRHLRKPLHVIPHDRIGSRELFRGNALRDWPVDQETTEGQA